MAEKERLEEQIGEVLGLEMAAQKAIEELSTRGLLNQGGLKAKLEGIKKEAGDTSDKDRTSNARTRRVRSFGSAKHQTTRQ